MKLKSTLSLILATLLLAILALAGCTNPIPPANTSAIQVSDQKDVEDWIKNSPTFKFDGIPGSIKIPNIVSSVDGNKTISAAEWEFTVEYQTTHLGHGDRTGQALAEVITHHTAVIIIKNGVITSAVCDDIWDIQADKYIAHNLYKKDNSLDYSTINPQNYFSYLQVKNSKSSS